MQKVRNPLVAFILSLFVLGLGQFYCARAKRAFILLGIGIIIMGVGNLFLNLNFLGSTLIAYILGIGYSLYVALDAWKIAKHGGEVQLKCYNKWYFYILYLLVPALMLIGISVLASAYILGMIAANVAPGSVSAMQETAVIETRVDMSDSNSSSEE